MPPSGKTRVRICPNKKAAAKPLFLYLLRRLFLLRFRVRQVGDAAFEHFGCQANGLVQSRVSVDSQRDVFSITAHLDRQTDFAQQLAAVGADNRTTDNTVRFFVENQLGHTVCAVRSDSTARCSPREGGGFVADAFLFRFFLRQTYPCNFWLSVGDGRNNFRIEVVFLLRR